MLVGRGFLLVSVVLVGLAIGLGHVVGVFRVVLAVTLALVVAIFVLLVSLLFAPALALFGVGVWVLAHLALGLGVEGESVGVLPGRELVALIGLKLVLVLIHLGLGEAGLAVRRGLLTHLGLVLLSPHFHLRGHGILLGLHLL